MARQKAYNEEEVIEKATGLFWKNGYATTSMRELEEAMGINKFSIYSSFESKQGVFMLCLNCYRKNLQPLLDKLIDSTKGADAIKEYFYDFLKFSKVGNNHKGCLLANTSNELGVDGEAVIKELIKKHSTYIKSIFIEKLKADKTKSKVLIAKQANFLLIATQGLSHSSKIMEKEAIDDFIDLTFKSI